MGTEITYSTSRFNSWSNWSYCHTWKGEKGSVGPAGERGTKGLQGDKGNRGLQGSKGPPGKEVGVQKPQRISRFNPVPSSFSLSCCCSIFFQGNGGGTGDRGNLGIPGLKVNHYIANTLSTVVRYWADRESGPVRQTLRQTLRHFMNWSSAGLLPLSCIHVFVVVTAGWARYEGSIGPTRPVRTRRRHWSGRSQRREGPSRTDCEFGCCSIHFIMYINNIHQRQNKFW